MERIQSIEKYSGERELDFTLILKLITSFYSHSFTPGLIIKPDKRKIRMEYNVVFLILVLSEQIFNRQIKVIKFYKKSSLQK